MGVPRAFVQTFTGQTEDRIKKRVLTLFHPLDRSLQDPSVRDVRERLSDDRLRKGKTLLSINTMSVCLSVLARLKMYYFIYFIF